MALAIDWGDDGPVNEQAKAHRDRSQVAAVPQNPGRRHEVIRHR